jgi:sugar lactone lactonase YvrE
VALDKAGNLYVLNAGNGALSVIAPGGAIRQVTGGLGQVNAVAVDSAGNAYVVETDGAFDTVIKEVVKVAPDGTVTPIAGAAQGIGVPFGVAVDATDNVYVSNTILGPAGELGEILKITPGGAVSIFVDDTHGLIDPNALTFDAAGDLYIADQRIFKVTPSGAVSQVTNGGRSPATGMAVDAGGNIYVTDAQNNQVDKITPAGAITPFAGAIPRAAGLAIDSSGNLLVSAETSDVIDTIDPSAVTTSYFTAPVAMPAGIVSDAAGNLYVASQARGTVIKLTRNGAVSVVGTGFGTPIVLALDAAGTLYVADQTSNSISTLAPDGTITPFVSGLAGAMAFDPAGNLLVAGQDGSFVGAVFKVAPNGTMSLLAGVGSVETPVSLAVDASGNVFAAVPGANIGVDHQPPFIAKITPQGGVSTFAQDSATVSVTGALAVDAASNLLDFSANPQGGGSILVRFAPDGTPTIVPNTGLDGAFGAMTLDPAGNLYGGDVVNNAIVQILLNPSPLASAILPGSRAVELGSAATVFATLINDADAALNNCQIQAPGSLAATLTLHYQPTDPATNLVTGALDTPVTIPAKAAQSFVIGFTASGPFSVAALAPFFACDGVAAAPITIGVNTVALGFSATPTADIVALAATSGGNGIVTVPFSQGADGAFALATVNAGAAGALTVEADTGGASLPITVTLCQTDPATAQCLAPPAAAVPVTIATGATPTFSVFVSAAGAISFAPGTSRIFARFLDGAGTLHGVTSVAVETD